MLPRLLICICLLTVAQTQEVQTSRQLRILGLFPHPGLSHFKFFQPIMRGLAAAGHEVSVVSFFPEKNPPVRYKDYPLTGFSELTNIVDLKMFEQRPSYSRYFSHFVDFFMLHDMAKQTCNLTLNSDVLAQVLDYKPGHFDVILLEQFNTDCMMGVAYKLRAPVIALSSCAILPWHYDRFGAPIITSQVPSVFSAQSEAMSFFGRVSNWFSFHTLNILYTLVSIPAADDLVRKKLGHATPSVGELVKDTSLMFVNQHYSYNGAKPLPPNIIELGGIHIQEAKPLPTNLQRILDNAEHGVIIISWGSMIRANSLPAAKRDGILRALARLKQQVIWKWENDTLSNKPDNVYISKWLPQRDILCHPNVKVFMSHAGLMGTSEATYCGVPVILTPMYGDQFHNAASIVHRGTGVLLNYEDINENTVLGAIEKALGKSYAENAKQLSYAYKHRPTTALQTAVWWVEHVAYTKGAPLLKSNAIYLSGFTYYSLDVYVFLIGVLIFIIYSLLFIIRRVCGRRYTSKPQKIKTN